jgi:hypothetical protein
MKPRKHAELIKLWADDDSLVIESTSKQAGWEWDEDIKPEWLETMEYRIQPTKPSIDWSHVADEYNWMATDSNGSCHIFTGKPESGSTLWKTIEERKTAPAKIYKSFKAGTCDWKDSLVMRPGTEAES